MPLTSFTTGGPWELDLDDLSWRRDIDRLRERAATTAMGLSRRRAVPDVGRLAEVALGVGGAVGRWVVHGRRGEEEASRRGLSRQLRGAAVRLGPTYIKLGQIVASGDGLFPDEVVEEMRSLRDRVKPERFGVIQSVVEGDLGAPLDDVFAHFETMPVASASIAQVHYATLVTGEAVAVKVQRPTVTSTVVRDLSVMAWAAPLLGLAKAARLANPPAIIEYLAETVFEELDFRLEADNMLAIAALLDAHGQDAIVVPRPHPTLVTERVLVMERLDGFALDDADAIAAAAIDTEAAMRALTIMLWEGSLIHGVFHGDLHGGNLRVLPDGRVALLDYGITGRISAERRPAFLRMIVSSLANDERGQLEALRDLGALAPDADLDALVGTLTPAASGAGVAENMQATVNSLLASGFRVPRELLLLVKNILYLNGATAVLAPDMDVIAEISHLISYLAAAHGDQIAAETGLDLAAAAIDPAAMFASAGIQTDGPLTFRQIRSHR